MKVKFFSIIIIFILSSGQWISAEVKNGNNISGNELVGGSVPVRTSERQKFTVAGKDYEMGEVFQYLIENNENISQVLYDAAKADSDFNKFQTKYSPVLVANGNFKNSDYPDDSVTGFSGTGKKEQSSTVALSKGFSTGTNVSAGIQHLFSETFDMNPAYGDVKYHQTAFFVKVEQELLKNVLGYQERRQETMLKNKETIIQELALYNVSSLSIDAIVSAWQYVNATSAYSNAELKLREANKVRSIVRANVNLGLNESIYLNYWNSMVAANEMSLAQKEYTLKEKEREFLLKFNIKDTDNVKNSVVVLSDKLPEIDVEKAMNTAYLNRADFIQADLALKNALMSREVYKNDALPSVKAGLSVSSVGQRDYLSDSYNDASKGENMNYEATLSVTYPLRNYEQETNERDASMAVKQSRLELSSVKKQVRNDVLNSVDAIQTSYTVYSKARRTRIEAEIYYTRLVGNLRKGRFSATDVKEALDGLVDSRQGELQALIQYNATLLQYDVVQNVLFKKHGIEMADLIKKKKDAAKF